MSIFKVATGKQINQIISLPDRCATLIGYNNRAYIYNLNMTLNPLIAVQKGAFLVEVSLVNNNLTNLRGYNFFRNKSSDEIIENLRKLNGLVKDTASGMETNPSFIIDIGRPIIIDMSAFISNSEISSLRNGILPNRNIKRIVTKSVASAQATNQQNPVTIVNSNDPGIPNGYGTTILRPDLVKEQMQNILFEGKIDPGSIWRRTNTYVSTRKTYGGIKPETTYTSNEDVQNDTRILNIISSQLSSATLAKEQNGLSAGDYITVVENIPVSDIPVNRTISLPSSIIGSNDFTLRFKVKNVEGKIFQILNYNVQHGINIGEFLPTGAPKVKTTNVSKQGVVSFAIQQTDPNAVGVYVYRRELIPNNPLLQTGYQEIAKVETGGDAFSGINAATFIDRSATSVNNYIYRFVPYTFEQVKSTAYASVAVKMFRGALLPEQKYLRLPNYGLIYSEIQNDGIRVVVRNIPQGVSNIYFYRRNITANQKEFQLVGIKQILNSTSADYSFTDPKTNLRNVYEYRADLLFKNGNTVTIPNTVQEKFEPVENSSALVQVKNIRTTGTGASIDVMFDVEYQLQEENFELFRKLLKEQNLLAEYQNEISNNANLLQTFLTYGITRTNLTTGQIEDFGIIPSNNFSDRTYGAAKNVTPINSSNAYRYTLTLYVRAPDTLFEELRRTVFYDVATGNVSNVPTGTTVEYQYSPYKWLNPLVLKTGNLISQDKHAEIALAQGYIADRKYVDVNVSRNTLAELSNVTATQIRPGSILIEWITTGNFEKIDHFIIKSKISGVVNIIGSAHNLMSTASFKFMYNLASEEAGAITFSVTPVYYDYSFGTETVTNTLVI